MRWRELIGEAARNLGTHRLRIFLSASGIVWGIALFFVLTSVGNSLRGFYRSKMEAIGRNAVYVYPATAAKRGIGIVAGRDIVLEDEDALRVPRTGLVKALAPEEPIGAVRVRSAGHTKVAWAVGTTPPAERIRNLTIADGRFFTPSDVARRARVLVLGAKLASRLFGRQPPVGRIVRFEGHRFRVVGVLAAKGQQVITVGPLDDEQVLLPLSTAQVLFASRDTIAHLVYEPRTRAEAERSIARVRTLLAGPHGYSPDDDEALTFFNVVDRIRPIALVEIALQVFLAACGALTLVAGGVGVMNAMLVAASERTQEIGLRKALGASDRDVMLGILLETVLLTVMAGTVGIALGGGIVGLLTMLGAAMPGAGTWVPQVTPSLANAATSFAVLVLTGILAAIAPAHRAAQLDPAIALRAE